MSQLWGCWIHCRIITYLEEVTGQVSLSKSQWATTRPDPDDLLSRNLY